MDEQLEILEDGHWIPVQCRARSRDGMKRLYRRMCNENPTGPPYGMRIVTVHEEHLGRLTPLRRSPPIVQSERRADTAGRTEEQ